MLFLPTSPQREFTVGVKQDITITDCGKNTLKADEQVTFLTQTNSEYDVVAKEWGFYATPSTNSRLLAFGLRTCIVVSDDGRIYVLLVAKEKENIFSEYLIQEGMKVLAWLDTPESAQKLIAFGNHILTP